MKKALEKAFLMGLGAYELTRKKAMQIARELEKEGALSKSESKKFVEDALKKAEKARQTLEKNIAEQFNSALKASLKELRSSIEALEKSVDKPPKKKKPGAKKKSRKSKRASKKK
ncbi:hypothetical protein D6764_04425 [Candidatus Woesearchaeota archaeon]|nr:MAG: hypothetical protein D6764_04425 [Candidatus Woesearchaeota archaeon]